MARRTRVDAAPALKQHASQNGPAAPHTETRYPSLKLQYLSYTHVKYRKAPLSTAGEAISASLSYVSFPTYSPEYLAYASE